MSYKPDEKDWMAYLYGELDDAEKRKFDQYILQHPEARRELEKFQNLRTILSSAEDKEVIAPPIFMEDSHSGGTGSLHRFFRNTPYIRVITAVAASLLLVILAGKLTGTKVTVSDREFRLSFGDNPAASPIRQVPTVSSLSSEEVQQMIN